MIAILVDEPERELFTELLGSRRSRISAANWFEAAMVAEGRGGRRATVDLDRLVDILGITIEPVTVEHATAARIAFRRYGKGSGSPAKLNFGDCFAYALSAATGEPLLFKGDDFTHTDILRAV
ncbi:type II toxin-antitoxin system VapC family toxin [Nocardioides sp. BYT-33-1]|uniref:type II toxin-antitoxin system VapC family toxin n=1 Tax=Nocardioides sp. BYT-33-1 TaxID=3416952 RepID=UPI003F53DBDF